MNGLVGPSTRFIRHAAEMCVVAMCIPAIALNFAFFTLASSLGYGDLRSTAPAVAIGFLTLTITIPMFVWMRYRGHDVGSSAEMAAGSVALAVVAAGLAVAGILTGPQAFEWITRLACPVMFVIMLIRWPIYSAPSAHAHHAM